MDEEQINQLVQEQESLRMRIEVLEKTVEKLTATVEKIQHQAKHHSELRSL